MRTKNRLERGARLVGAAQGLRDLGASKGRSVLFPDRRERWDRVADAVRAEMDEETFSKALAEGRAMTLKQAIEYAMEEMEE